MTAGGCSDDGSESSRASEVGSRHTTTTPSAAAGLPSATQVVAQSTGQVEVWAAPDDDDATSSLLSASTEPSGALTFLVLDEVDDEWLHVLLPTQPVGSQGFVRVADVSLNRHRFRIEVARGAHTLKVFAGDVEALTALVALGPDAPPAGTNTYIKELLVPPDGTPYGGHVYGLAGWSSTEAQFGAGAGVVAIHAAGPETLGTDTPMGAIGTDRQVLTRLVDNVGIPLGTPVNVLP